jgi:uncharacterized protein YdeI (YjbR/CyaY-like superfamily)
MPDLSEQYRDTDLRNPTYVGVTSVDRAIFWDVSRQRSDRLDSTATFFESASAFRRWLETHHDSASELWIGFYKKESGREGISYREAVMQALCFGWIDGKVQRIDDTRYRQRFSPRKATSIWSNVNICLVEQLQEQGLMHPAGIRAFEARKPEKSGVYAFEQDEITLAPAYEARLRADDRAWTFLQNQPPGYRRLVTHFVMSAKREDTRVRRLEALVESSAEGRRLARFVSLQDGKPA